MNCNLFLKYKILYLEKWLAHNFQLIHLFFQVPKISLSVKGVQLGFFIFYPAFMIPGTFWSLKCLFHEAIWFMAPANILV
jgi:hypothetical protein